MTNLEITSSDDTRTLAIEGNFSFISHIQLYSHTLQVKEDFNDIFLYPFNRAVFMQYTFDFCLNDGTAWHA